MLLDVSLPPVDILLLDSQVNEKVINKRKNIRGMIRLIITKSTHHATNKKPHECDDILERVKSISLVPTSLIIRTISI